MKTSGIIGAFIICTSLLVGQNNNAKSEQDVKVRIKKIENVNGVETVTDSTYTTNDPSLIKIEGEDIQIFENKKEKDGSLKKVIVINEKNSVGEGADVKIIGDGDIDKEVEAALKDADIVLNKNGQCVQKRVIIDRRDDKSEDTKSVKKVTKVMIIRKAMISDVTSEDINLVNKLTGLTDNKLPLNEMKFYPNPNNGKFNLSFSLKEKANTNITILNMEGKNIYSEKLDNFTGTYDKEIDISKNPKGVYFVKIEQGTHSQLKKIVLD